MTANAMSMSGVELLEAIRDGVLPPPGFAITTGIRIDTIEPGRVVFTVDADERLYNPLGTVHGGLLTTLADSAMGCAVQSVLEAGATYTTVDLNMHFVKAARIGRLFAEGTVVHSGGRIATAEARVTTDDGTLVAHGSSTCIIMRAPRGATPG